MLCLLCLFSVNSLKKKFFEPWDFSSSSGLFVCIKRQRINSSDNKKRAAKREKSLTLPDGVNEDYCCVCFVCVARIGAHLLLAASLFALSHLLVVQCSMLLLLLHSGSSA